VVFQATSKNNLPILPKEPNQPSKKQQDAIYQSNQTPPMQPIFSNQVMPW
jgi:hypothetical protein